MNEKEKEGHQKTVEPAKVACLSCSTNSESYLPKYSEIPYSHVDNMEKGCLCLQSDPVPPYSRRHQEASIHMAQGNGFFILLRDVLSALLWLIFWPAKIARIPEAQRRQENEALRLGWCLNGSIILNFFFSYKYLVPFIKESMKEYVLLWFQITVAAVLVIVAFYMFLFVCSLLVDFIVILIPLVASGGPSFFSSLFSGISTLFSSLFSGISTLFSGISSFFSSLFSGISTLFSGISSFLSSLFSGISSAIMSALGFRMPSERNDLTADSCIPLNSMSSEPEYQFNDCSDNTLEQPSSEHSEQSPGLRREPGQSRDVENSES
ncbi:uncharacterized protein SOCG_02782 [Schizosaccharomyces octosporus yFS286]|uniref:Uncharacterized protein n=1 Tax=Schizosaccharomyces octosporus (strain yFS286) TaxID=483514 RepID=S9PWY3_SCHOY|nr:uncharacterized protein SOCG_02782 [Schizosaccharomyces octosporus yFS286]EPX73561.1 hypothetical protein SOCG_02782 [Schizosaccharomyces octosporus yFS286]